MATNYDTSFRIVKSSKGNDKLSHDGYLYIFHRGTAKKEWRCNMRGCRARVHSVDEIIVKKSGEYSLRQEYGKAEVAVVKDLLRKQGRETKDSSHVAIDVTSSLSESAKSLLPIQHALKMMYKRQRTAPPNPMSLKTVRGLFCQLYTIHCLNGGPNPFENGHLLTCVYALLPNKSTSTDTKKES